ncbi:Cu(I)-responsive transcriptional regulator [Parapusillimonas granuli]|uniref:Cu(I)-responsive transcriptional regulator n=1 Tax=Parapusillimonas granuli TaxID=380911 RepID=A0A853G423_9BURK|nr:Cu(I)-responsive transcriptional regulator [Parapusillimonas granuli]MBB5214161.1 Cu(I)-responsive transcriptional regulator [Parapusillimonas granuli]NYT50582.1 Cu(I)-responsive transcriptional regulator [Parapusillimonas granuli]
MNIGEASEASAVSRKMIRYYESIGLIQPARRSDAGYRKYGANDVEALRFIKRSRELGFSLDRIRTLIGLWEDTTRQSADVKRLAQQHIDELDRDIAKLQSIRDQLAHLVDCCHGDSRPECPILADLGARSQNVPEQQGG